ncbi:hypothetical protein Anapl_02018 [Anas platyrhynchos]|uniref:Uncharacterized protein n=1 Tax=Anas platyrhynchos TaxID=8839 RepID=R0M4C2_ANAPL|nr:hypothetical protein Anapl_02018 [Anas platyrhynchos]
MNCPCSHIHVVIPDLCDGNQHLGPLEARVFMTSAKSGQAGLFKRYVMTTINKETDGQCTVDMSEKNKNVETKAIGRTEACDNRKDSPRTGVWFRELRGDLCASLRPPASLESQYFSGRTGGSSSGHNPQVPGRTHYLRIYLAGITVSESFGRSSKEGGGRLDKSFEEIPLKSTRFHLSICTTQEMDNALGVGLLNLGAPSAAARKPARFLPFSLITGKFVFSQGPEVDPQGTFGTLAANFSFTGDRISLSALSSNPEVTQLRSANLFGHLLPCGCPRADGKRDPAGTIDQTGDRGGPTRPEPLLTVLGSEAEVHRSAMTNVPTSSQTRPPGLAITSAQQAPGECLRVSVAESGMRSGASPRPLALRAYG